MRASPEPTVPGFPRGAQHLLPPATIAGLTALLAAACVKQLPPVATPEAVVPAVATAAPPDRGRGRLVVDVVDGPTRVHRVHMKSEPFTDGAGRASFQFFESPEVLCDASPCVADVPVGNVLLGFPVLGDPDAMETELVHVGPEASVYRRSLSVYQDDSGSVTVLGIIGTSLGGCSAITGVALLPIGLATGSDGLTTAGGITLGAGAALIALGIWALRHDAATFRPGASHHFSLSSPGGQ